MAENDRGGLDSPSRRLRIFSVLTCRNWFVVGAVLLLFTVIFVAVSISLFGNSVEPPREPFAAFTGCIDSSMDPCRDFYDFACRMWPEKRPGLATYLNSFQLLQEEIDERKAEIFREAAESPDLPEAVNSAITFYKTCVARNFSHGDYKALTNVLTPIGGWPITNESEWDKHSFDWLNATAFYQKNFKLDFVFRVSLSAGPNSTRIFLKHAPKIGDYSGLTIDSILLNINCPSIHTFRDVLFEAYYRWIELLESPVDAADETIVSLEDLMTEFSSIDFFQYFKFLYQDSLLAINRSLTLQDIVVVDNINYLRKVDKLLNSDTFSSFELANLFGLFLAQKIFVLIPGVLETYGKSLDYSAEDIYFVAEKYCYQITEEIFKSSVDYLYVKRHRSQETMDKTELVIKYVQLAFHNTVLNSQWLDEESRTAALKTLDEMEKVIGFPSYLTDQKEFDLLHSDLPVLSNNILESYIAFQKLELLCGILPRSVTDVSMYYIGNHNTLVFPISVYNPPFFYSDGPSYLNFGAMGALVGHEMMHAFGSFNDAVDSVLSSNDFKSEACSAAFKNHTQCFIEQFEDYDTSDSLSKSGAHTLRENVADAEGLRVAYVAHKQYEADFGPDIHVKGYGNYSSDQMFFISFATVWCSKIVPQQYNDPHNVPNMRLNGAVSNLKSFAQAFSCPENSPMNPSKKCLIW